MVRDALWALVIGRLLACSLLLSQGVFIKRHKLTKEDGVSFFSPSDFDVGEAVTIYGRT